MQRGKYTWDLTALTPEHKATVQGALNACVYPFGRIRRKTGKKVPVMVGDISRFNLAAPTHGTLDAHDDHGHHEEQHAQGVHVLANSRKVALGLYWLPTDAYPAGRVELSQDIMDNTDLAQEVFLAEAAHAVDYGAMTDLDRVRVFSIVHGGSSDPHGTHGWFEEAGGQDYWADWVGEVFMGLFMRAFAPTLPSILMEQQPFSHKITHDMALQTRRYLRRKIRW